MDAQQPPSYLLATCPHHADPKFVCECQEEDALQGQKFAVGLVGQAQPPTLFCLQPDAHTRQTLHKSVRPVGATQAMFRRDMAAQGV